MSDVQAVYDVLVSRDGVQTENMGIAGASCGVFMGLEFTLNHSNIKSFASLGGPTQERQRMAAGYVIDRIAVLESADGGELINYDGKVIGW